jgi:hypothetical protein
MANRNWRVAANFHRVGDVVVTVTSPNWQGAIRKAALVIKRLPELKGRRLNMGTFMLQEVEGPAPVQEVTEQLSLEASNEAQGTNPSSTEGEEQGS